MSTREIDRIRVSSVVPIVETGEDKTMMADKTLEQQLSHHIADERMAKQLSSAAKQRITSEKWQQERPQNPSPPDQQPDYFRMFASGFGYIFDFKNLEDASALSRYQAKVFVLQGMGEQLHYEYHELTVSEPELIDTLLRHHEAIQDKTRKVLLHFNMSNPRARAYIHKSIEQEPKIVSFISGFMVDILSIKIDNTTVYPKSEDDQEDSTAPLSYSFEPMAHGQY